MAYPDDIFVQRELENLPGLEYDVDNKKSLFAEDMLGHGEELIRIEEVLGLNPQGDYDTVAERLDDSGGGSSFLYERKVIGSGINSIIFDTAISMDTLTFLRLRYIFPGRLSNNSLRLLINNDTTPGNYPRTIEVVGYSTVSVATASSSNLAGLSTNSATEDYTTTWDFELRKLAGKYLNVRGWCSTDGGDIDSGFRHLNFNYLGSSADITDVRFNRDSGNFPVGTIAILSEV